MGIFDLFRRPPPLATLPALDDFLDSQSAFLVQKCIFEYARARSGILSAKLFKEPAFLAAIEQSRWRNYPICLGHVALMADAALRPHAPERAVALADGLAAAAGRITRRYDIPAGMAPDFWAGARKGIESRIRRASLAAPHPVRDIPRDEFKAFFERLPIHESLRGHDVMLVRNNLRINLCRAYETFVARMDAPALVALLTGEAGTADTTPADHAAG
jgi:hypothetical protein